MFSTESRTNSETRSSPPTLFKNSPPRSSMKRRRFSRLNLLLFIDDLGGEFLNSVGGEERVSELVRDSVENIEQDALAQMPSGAPARRTVRGRPSAATSPAQLAIEIALRSL